MNNKPQHCLSCMRDFDKCECHLLSMPIVEIVASEHNKNLMLTIDEYRNKPKLAALQKLLDEALELLHEVKPYRSSFYKQKVGELVSKYEKLK